MEPPGDDLPRRQRPPDDRLLRLHHAGVPRAAPAGGRPRPRPRTCSVPHRRAAPAVALVAGVLVAGVLVAAGVLAPAAGARGARRAFTGGPGPVVIPIFAGELAAPMAAYRGDVRRLLATLQGQVETLVGQVDAGDVPGAESAWLTAHLTWLDIGQDDGAYGVFGDLG